MRRLSLSTKAETALWQKSALIAFGFFLALVVLEFSLRLGGFLFISLQEYRNQQALKRKDAYCILCIGESTTQGQYPRFLEESLKRGNPGIGFTVIDKGLAGTNTFAILDNITAYLDLYRPDIVIAMMGINDEATFMPPVLPATGRNAPLVGSLKIYRLARFLWLRTLTKAKEIKTLTPLLDAVRIYTAEKSFGKKEEAFKKLIRLHPHDAYSYVRLGEFYRDYSQFSLAEAVFKKAIECAPMDPEAYGYLGWVYKGLGRFTEAERFFNKSVSLNLKNGKLFLNFALLYIEQHRFPEAEALLKKAILSVPSCEEVHGLLAWLYEEQGKGELAARYYQKAEERRQGANSKKTVNNYLKLAETIRRNKAILVCVQYPKRPVTSLKRIFYGKQDGILFVDNEKSFKDAIDQEGHEAYFRDAFAGDFGHCTEKGNKLLAENIARVIIKEIFHK